MQIDFNLALCIKIHEAKLGNRWDNRWLSHINNSPKNSTQQSWQTHSDDENTRRFPQRFRTEFLKQSSSPARSLMCVYSSEPKANIDHFTEYAEP